MSILNLFNNQSKQAETSLSVPVLDGAFKPNALLDDSAVRTHCKDPDNLVEAGGAIYFSSGTSLLGLSAKSVVKQKEDGKSPITAMAGASDGTLAVARSGEGVTLISHSGKRTQFERLDITGGDVTSMAFISEKEIAVTVGAKGRRADEWQTDLMRRGRTGSVWIYDTQGHATKRAENLAYPCGVVQDSQGNLVVSLGWESSLARIDQLGNITPVLENLPGYPCRLIRSATGGYWLAIFAPRNQLVEFVLQEKLFCNRMLKEVDPQHWVCPSIYPRVGQLDVMQEGAQKIGGEIKPWAPSLSYGLIVQLDEEFSPVQSFHSRANGHRHGITSLLESDKCLLASSRGGDVIVEIQTEKVK